MKRSRRGSKHTDSDTGFRPRRLRPLVLACLALTACTRPANGPVVTTEAGALRGVLEAGVASFKGIPYSAPPVGELRWRAPQPVTPWPGIRAATGYAPHCAQTPSTFMVIGPGPASEDCLYLNVWTPEPDAAQRRAVMVWIHGGGFMQGSGHAPATDGTALAREGVVLVTLNYRLNIFGFLAHPALAGDDPATPSANFGLQDAVAALRWVRRNIAAFGGDPDNVTIFGESAGADIVNYLMVMPAATGLFQRAISQSASLGVTPDAHLTRRMGFKPSGYAQGEDFVRRTGIAPGPDQATALRALDARALLALLKPSDRLTPVIDGAWLPDHASRLFAEGHQQRVPYLTGGNSWEASLGRRIGGGFSPENSARLVPAQDQARLYPGLEGEALADEIFGDLVIHSAAQYLSGEMARQGGPVYRYFLSYLPEARRGRQPGVGHAEDIALVMGTLDAEPDLAEVSARDRERSRLMRAWWVQFAKTGDPNRGGLPTWPAYDRDSRRVLEIGDEIGVRTDFREARLAYHVARGLALLERLAGPAGR